MFPQMLFKIFIILQQTVRAELIDKADENIPYLPDF